MTAPDFTQLSDVELDAKLAENFAEAQAIDAERRRRADDLDEWLELVARVYQAGGGGGGRGIGPDEAIRAGEADNDDRAAARMLRDHTRLAVDAAIAKAKGGAA